MCLFKTKSIVNKSNMIGITEYWASADISDAEFEMTGYVMFRKNRTGRRMRWS